MERATIPTDKKTRQKLAIIKADQMFRTYSNTIDSLIFVYKSIPDEKREKLKKNGKKRKEV